MISFILLQSYTLFIKYVAEKRKKNCGRCRPLAITRHKGTLLLLGTQRPLLIRKKRSFPLFPIS